jgi:hypothetical protein
MRGAASWTAARARCDFYRATADNSKTCQREFSCALPIDVARNLISP